MDKPFQIPFQVGDFIAVYPQTILATREKRDFKIRGREDAAPLYEKPFRGKVTEIHPNLFVVNDGKWKQSFQWRELYCKDIRVVIINEALSEEVKAK